MAFGGVPNVTVSTRNYYEVLGLTLGANVGAFDPTGVAADSGLLSTAAAPPVGAIALPTTFGPGQGNWTAADVAMVWGALFDGSVVANVRIAPVWRQLVGGDLLVGVHSLEAGAPAAIGLRLTSVHTVIR